MDAGEIALVCMCALVVASVVFAVVVFFKDIDNNYYD